MSLEQLSNQPGMITTKFEKQYEKGKLDHCWPDPRKLYIGPSYLILKCLVIFICPKMVKLVSGESCAGVKL